MAHKKAGSASSNGRDSAGRRLGVKKGGGQPCYPGQHHYSSAWHSRAPGQKRRHGQRPYAVCENCRYRNIQKGQRRPQDGTRCSRRRSEITQTKIPCSCGGFFIPYFL